MSNNPKWTYIRVIVDVPVKSKVREKDIVWGIQAAIDAGHHHIKRRGFDEVAYGSIKVKAGSKVMASERRILTREIKETFQ